MSCACVSPPRDPLNAPQKGGDQRKDVEFENQEMTAPPKREKKKTKKKNKKNPYWLNLVINHHSGV